jgi:hypothetical protein
MLIRFYFLNHTPRTEIQPGAWSTQIKVLFAPPSTIPVQNENPFLAFTKNFFNWLSVGLVIPNHSTLYPNANFLRLRVTRHPWERHRVLSLSNFGTELSLIRPADWASFQTGVSSTPNKPRVAPLSIAAHT